MARARFRAFKCRLGVHRGTVTCKDCRLPLLALAADAFARVWQGFAETGGFVWPTVEMTAAEFRAQYPRRVASLTQRFVDLSVENLLNAGDGTREAPRGRRCTSCGCIRATMTRAQVFSACPNAAADVADECPVTMLKIVDGEVWM